ncbi:antibiotic biosynthesis monooxygenase family protein [Chitinimonas naiadis]
MSQQPVVPSTSLFRVDKFSVPAAASAAFAERLRHIQALLSSMPGCRQNRVLTQVSGPSEFNMVTIVEWESADAMAVAQAATQKHYAEQGFDPKAFMQQHGIRPDMGLYGA